MALQARAARSLHIGRLQAQATARCHEPGTLPAPLNSGGCSRWRQAGPSIALQASPAAPAVPASEEKGKRARAARCGSCTGCVRGDCGECKNCLDKPKFGGRGIKKQACIQRSCNNPQPEEESDNEIAQSTSSTASTGFLSEDASPAMLPIAGEPGAIALLELDSVQRTQPRGERLKPQSGMTLQTRKMLKQVRAESGSPGYSTADEEVAEPAAPSEVSTPVRFYAPFRTLPHHSTPTASRVRRRPPIPSACPCSCRAVQCPWGSPRPS